MGSLVFLGVCTGVCSGKYFQRLPGILARGSLSCGDGGTDSDSFLVDTLLLPSQAVVEEHRAHGT